MMQRLSHLMPILRWAPNYQRRDLRGDLAAGLTIGAMLVPQAMAYALLAGLPPVVGLYAATIPVIAYALFGSSGQLAVGPVAIVSLLTATALAPLVEQGTVSYISAAALLALMVGAIHLVLGVFRLGFVVNFLSHSVLVGFTAAAAIIIGFSQVKHVLGISIPRTDQFIETVREVIVASGDTHLTTLVIGLGSILVLLTLKRYARAVPAALVVVVASTAAVSILGLEARGVATVGDIPAALPSFGLPEFDGTLMRSLLATAVVITIVGFMESVAVAKVYARRNRYDIDPNQELVGLGMSNVAAGAFGGYPVTGGFSRTAVNANAGARTPLASLISAGLVLATLAFFTPLFHSLPQAALGAIIIVAVINLVDIAEMRHIATVKRSDLVSLSTGFFATLLLGIEIGIGIAVVTSMLVVFARMSKPHTAVLGRVPGTTSYRNVGRFTEAETTSGVRVIRIDAALSFVNASHIKRLVLSEAEQIESTAGQPRRLVIDCSGINDIDATGVGAFEEILTELCERQVTLHLAGVKGPVRDVLRNAHLWDRLEGRIHATTHDAATAAAECVAHPRPQVGVDERSAAPNLEELPHA
jgi:SulP family sulfate permease